MENRKCVGVEETLTVTLTEMVDVLTMAMIQTSDAGGVIGDSIASLDHPEFPESVTRTRPRTGDVTFHPLGFSTIRTLLVVDSTTRVAVFV